MKGSSNKAELFHLISKKITRNRTDHKMVLATQGKNVIFSSIIVIDRFSSCNHEEADTRMFLHLKHFLATGHCKVSLKTVDKDVVIITISLFHKLDLEELWIEFGTGVNLEWLPIQEYAENLGESICQGMPVWFAFTGCHTVFWAWHEVGLENIQIVLCCNRFIQNVSYYFIIITIWLASQNT